MGILTGSTPKLLVASLPVGVGAAGADCSMVAGATMCTVLAVVAVGTEYDAGAVSNDCRAGAVGDDCAFGADCIESPIAGAGTLDMFGGPTVNLGVG